MRFILIIIIIKKTTKSTTALLFLILIDIDTHIFRTKYERIVEVPNE